MERNSKLAKVIMYQNVGFLAVIALGFLDELVRFSSLLFMDQPFSWEFRRTTLGMLLVLAVWFVVSASTRRILDRIRYLEQFMRVCAWCHHIDYKGGWISFEEFLKQGFDTPTTHGICPKCLAEQKAEIRRAREGKLKVDQERITEAAVPGLRNPGQSSPAASESGQVVPRVLPGCPLQ